MVRVEAWGRCAEERGREGLLQSLLARDDTRVLDVVGDAVRMSAPGQRTRSVGAAVSEPPRLAWRAPGAADGEHVEQMAFLGRDGEGRALVAAWYLDRGPDDVGLREAGPLLEAADVEAAMTGVALARWHAGHGFCPRCGNPTEPAAAGWVRHCQLDQAEHYPRTDPAVIMAVVDGEDRLLLARGPSFAPGRMSVLAGFVEPGERLEQAVAREVAEEVGVRVGDVRYVGSQPWPFPASLMLGFTARAADVDLRPDPAEIAECAWFSRSELAEALADGRLGIPGKLSIARRLIEGWYGAPLVQRVELGSIRR